MRRAKLRHPVGGRRRANPQALSSLLELNHHRVRQAGGGAEALAKMRHKPPKLLLLDLQMPEVSGFDVLRTMKLEARLERVPVIIVTTQPPESVRELDVRACSKRRTTSACCSCS